MASDGFLLLLKAAEIMRDHELANPSNEPVEVQALRDIFLQTVSTRLISFNAKIDNICNEFRSMGPLAVVSDNSMQSIGSGKTTVSNAAYKQIDWTSYITATRQLLMAVFCECELAMHSLTGETSNIFNCHKCLDPVKVNDIVTEITEKYDIDDSLVRRVIEDKCSEVKKYEPSRNIKKRRRSID